MVQPSTCNSYSEGSYSFCAKAYIVAHLHERVGLKSEDNRGNSSGIRGQKNRGARITRQEKYPFNSVHKNMILAKNSNQIVLAPRISLYKA